MSSLLGDTGGKSRSASQSGRLVPSYLQTDVKPGYQPIQNETFRQISEALRTGGIGAQIPIIQQAVSQGKEALGNSLQQTEGSLASAGLGRTPYGQNILAQTRQAGASAIGRIPTDYAQQISAQAPGVIQGLMPAILGALAAVQTSTSRSGPYNT